jgi:hypothetical protein
MAFWKSQKLSILWITKILFENISHSDLPFLYYTRMARTKECTAKYHPVQSSFSTDIKFQGEGQIYSENIGSALLRIVGN